MTPTFPLRALRTARASRSIGRVTHRRMRNAAASVVANARPSTAAIVALSWMRRSSRRFCVALSSACCALSNGAAATRARCCLMRSSRCVLVRSTKAPPATTMTRYTSETKKRRRRSDTPALYLDRPGRLGPNYQPRRSTSHVSTTSSPVARCIRSWYATVGSMCAGNTRTRSPTATGVPGPNVTCSSEQYHTV